MEITGTIEGKAVDEGISKTGEPYVRYVFTIDGKKYSTFDEEIGKGDFKVGDYVSMAGNQKGKFFNMKSMYKLDKKPEEQAGISGIKEEVERSDSDSQKIIIDLLRKILAELKTNK